MSFPLSPTNGQTVIINGTTYVYSTTYGTWTVVNGTNDYGLITGSVTTTTDYGSIT